MHGHCGWSLRNLKILSREETPGLSQEAPGFCEDEAGGIGGCEHLAACGSGKTSRVLASPHPQPRCPARLGGLGKVCENLLPSGSLVSWS